MESLFVNNSYMNSCIRDDFNFYNPLYTKNFELIKSSSYEVIVFGEIIEDICNGSTPLDGKYEDEGVYFFRSQNFNSEGLDFEDMKYVTKEFHSKLKRSALKPNDILIAVVGATLGVASIVPKNFTEGNINQNVSKITLKENHEILPHYVMIFLDSKFGNFQFLKESTITAKGYINNDKIKRLLIILPSLNIQKNISKLMQSAYFLRKQKLKQAEEELGKIDNYILNELHIDLSKIEDEKSFNIKISQLSNRDDYGYYDKRVENLIKKIRNMKNNKLGNLSSLIYRYPTFFGLKYRDEGIWVIKGENIVDSQIKELGEEDYIIQEDANRFPKTILKENDIIMSVRGTIGKCGVVPKRLENKSIINANMIRIVINNDEVIPAYIHIFLTSSMGQMFLERQSTKAVQSTITVPYIENIDVPIPSKETQENIINFVQKAHNLNKEKIKQSDELIEESKQIIEKIIIGEALTKQEEQFCNELIQEAKKLGFKE